MKRVLMADIRSAFMDTLSKRLLVMEVPFGLIGMITEEKDIAIKVQEEKPDELWISASLVRPGMTFRFPGTKVIAYAGNEEEVEQIRKAGLNCFGIVKKPADLAKLAENGELLFEAPEDDRAQILNQGMLQEIQQEQKKTTSEAVTVKPPVAPSAPAEPPKAVVSSDVPRFDPRTGKPLNSNPVPRPENSAAVQSVPEAPKESVTPPPAKHITKGEMIRETERQKDEQEKSALQKQVEESMKAPTKRKTKVVTVFSPKGGVGKTTISCELAEYLSLTNDGRGRYRVCLLDYNIDFGNVRDRMNLDPNGVLITHWAAEIQEKIRQGKDPSQLEYTKEEIERFLQKRPESELYVLVGPSVHADSMDISGEALEAILRNVIQNGGYDFVIVDTGNNTRDAAYFPLCSADEILMIATQDVSTANSIDSFLEAAKALPEVDTSKIKLVVNDIFPEKETGISVEEIEGVFKEYQTVAKIRHNSDVKNYGNQGIMLATNAKHPFTKEMRQIVLYVTNQKSAEVEVESGFSGILKRLLRK